MIAPRLIAGLLFAIIFSIASSHAQERPVLPNEEEFGRPTDATELNVCIDQRDPAWMLDEVIAREVAAVLLLEPQIHYVGGSGVSSPFDDVYYHLRADCRVYFGFKLIAEHYPTWVTVTRPYYYADYVFVGTDRAVERLSDLPPGTAIGATAASMADFQFLQYNNALGQQQRWRRIPFGNDERTLGALEAGTVAAALIWGPSLLAYEETGQSNPGLKILDPEPVRLESMAVGGILLSTDSYLRTQLDDAIASLTADGVLDDLVAGYRFLGTMP